MYYLNLHIIQSPNRISINQTDYVKDAILFQCFPDTYERVTSSPNPFKTDSTFELDWLKLFLSPPTDIHHLEENYLRKSSAHISKILQMMQIYMYLPYVRYQLSLQLS